MLTALPELAIERERALPRYSQRPLPPYRFVPGLFPHPVRDPQGHSYLSAHHLHRQERWEAEHWRSLEDWLYGVDLFNRYYFWESHHAWEGLWSVAERDGAPRLLLQGLIQVAAACLKAHMGVLTGTRMLSAEGLAKLRRVEARQSCLLGLDLSVIVAEFEGYFVRVISDPVPRLSPDVPILLLD